MNPLEEIKSQTPTYHRVHHFLRKNYGKPVSCSNKDCNKANGRLHWALLKGKKYSYDIKDYKPLCPSCHKIYDMTEEIRKKMSISQKGSKKPWVSKYMTGLKMKKKTKLKIRKANLGKFGIKVLDLTNNKMYSSLREASEKTKTNRISITNMLAGRAKTANKRIWQYVK